MKLSSSYDQSWTEAELDARDEAIRTQNPKGLTPDQWRMETLLSARADGLLHPPSVAHPRHPLLMHSLMMSLFFKGWATQRDGRKGGPWVITDAGREHVDQRKV